MAVVEPNPVLGLKIAADVNVRRTIAIQIAEDDRKAPIKRRSRERFALRVEKPAGGPRNGREMAFAVVEVEEIRLAEFKDMTIRGDFQTVPVFGANHPAVALAQEHETGGADGVRP